MPEPKQPDAGNPPTYALSAATGVLLTSEDDTPPAPPRPAVVQELGLAAAELPARFPGCTLGGAQGVEQLSPLTDDAAVTLGLLPARDGRILATSHSLRSTTAHASPPAPALDATRVTRWRLACPSREDDATVLLYRDRILAILPDQQPSHRFEPAPIAAAEMAAMLAGPGDRIRLATSTRSDLPETDVVALVEGRHAGAMVVARPPRQLHADHYLQWSGVTYAAIDMDLWRDYARDVRATLALLAQGRDAGFAEACPATACAARHAAPPPRPPASPLLAALALLAAGGDLTNPSAFGHAMGGRAVLLQSGLVRTSLDAHATEPYTLGLAPGHTLLDGSGFAARIIPDGYDDHIGALSPYHRLVAELRLMPIGACVTRQDLTTRFGPDGMRTNAFGDPYAHRFTSPAHPGTLLFVAAYFPLDGAADCAFSLTLSEYRRVSAPAAPPPRPPPPVPGPGSPG